MEKVLLLLLLCAAPLACLAQHDLKLVSVKRKFKDNREWIVSTSKGQGSLKNVFSDGTEWVLEVPGHGKYTFKQVYAGDPSEWRIARGDAELFFTLSFGKDYNEWRTGHESEFVYVKTVFKNDWSEWKAESSKGTCAFKAVFSDGSEWRITDGLKEDALTKLSSLFAVLVTAQLRR